MNIEVAVIGTNQAAVSETFIHAHARHLAKGRHYLYGHNGFYYHDGQMLTGRLPVWKRLFYRLGKGSSNIGFGALENYLLRHKIEFVLAEYGTVGADIFGLCRKIGIPFGVYFRGFDISTKAVLDKYESLYRKMAASADCIFVVSNHMKPVLRQFGVPLEKITWNPSFPDSALFLQTPGYQQHYFLSVGRFVEKKAPHLTLLAFHKVLQQQPQARLMMVGDGPLKGACEWLVRSYGMEHAVEFTGALPHSEVQNKFEQVFCLVQHSVTATNGDSEGTPVAVLEAGAAGLPVVATRHAGIPDVVVEDETGILVNEGDVEAMAAAMLRLYQNRSLCAQMGSAARSRIREHFSMEKHFGILNDLIEQAINSKNQIPNSKK